jgi:hypothetical protein
MPVHCRYDRAERGGSLLSGVHFVQTVSAANPYNATVIDESTVTGVDCYFDSAPVGACAIAHVSFSSLNLVTQATKQAAFTGCFGYQNLTTTVHVPFYVENDTTLGIAWTGLQMHPPGNGANSAWSTLVQHAGNNPGARMDSVTIVDGTVLQTANGVPILVTGGTGAYEGCFLGDITLWTNGALPARSQSDLMFGTGSDGAITFDGTTTYAGFSTLSGSTYTLTRDVQATTIVVNTGVQLNAAGYRILATQYVANAGVMRPQGALGSAGGGGGAAGQLGTLASGAAGGGAKRRLLEGLDQTAPSRSVVMAERAVTAEQRLEVRAAP